jgi:hypothetical protein
LQELEHITTTLIYVVTAKAASQRIVRTLNHIKPFYTPPNSLAVFAEYYVRKTKVILHKMRLKGYPAKYGSPMSYPGQNYLFKEGGGGNVMVDEEDHKDRE